MSQNEFSGLYTHIQTLFSQKYRILYPIGADLKDLEKGFYDQYLYFLNKILNCFSMSQAQLCQRFKETENLIGEQHLFFIPCESIAFDQCLENAWSDICRLLCLTHACLAADIQEKLWMDFDGNRTAPDFSLLSDDCLLLQALVRQINSSVASRLGYQAKEGLSLKKAFEHDQNTSILIKADQGQGIEDKVLCLPALYVSFSMKLISIILCEYSYLAKAQQPSQPPPASPVEKQLYYTALPFFSQPRAELTPALDLTAYHEINDLEALQKMLAQLFSFSGQNGYLKHIRFPRHLYDDLLNALTILLSLSQLQDPLEEPSLILNMEKDRPMIFATQGWPLTEINAYKKYLFECQRLGAKRYLDPDHWALDGENGYWIAPQIIDISEIKATAQQAQLLKALNRYWDFPILIISKS